MMMIHLFWYNRSVFELALLIIVSSTVLVVLSIKRRVTSDSEANPEENVKR
jgi:hypothetical protein